MHNSIANRVYRLIVGDRKLNALEELRGATYRGDGAAVVEVLRRNFSHDVLQLAGSGLLVAVAQGVPEVDDLAVQCEAALRERDWAGDKELADQLSAILKRGPTPMLLPLPVDLDDLSELLEGDPLRGGGQIDLQTGMCWPDVLLDDQEDIVAEGDLDDADRWLYVDCEGPRDGYLDMEMFIATIDDPAIADRLDIAIQGRGAFRRFKTVLSRWPAEFARYSQFSAERKQGRARAWLADRGYRPVQAART